MAFRKSFRVGKVGRINVSKSGVGASVGGKWARIGTGPRGSYVTRGIPGTGMRTTTHLGKGSTGGAVATQADDLGGGGQEAGIGCLFVVALITLLIYPPLGIALLVGFIGLWIQNRRSASYKACRLLQQAEKKGQEVGAALSLLREAHGLVPESTTIIWKAGLLAHNNGDWEQAVEWLDKLSELQPSNDTVKFMLGHCHYQREQYEEAISALQDIDDSFENHTSVVILLGGAFSEKGDYETAVEVFKRGPLRKRKLDTELLELHYQLGWHYEKLGNKKSAQRHFRRVVSVDAGYRDAAERLDAVGG